MGWWEDYRARQKGLAGQVGGQPNPKGVVKSGSVTPPGDRPSQPGHGPSPSYARVLAPGSGEAGGWGGWGEIMEVWRGFLIIKIECEGFIHELIISPQGPVSGQSLIFGDFHYPFSIEVGISEVIYF